MKFLKKKKITNGDFFRSLNDENLAFAFISYKNMILDLAKENGIHPSQIKDDEKIIIEWLQKPKKEE